MKQLNKQELLTIEGGKFKWGIGAIAIATATFIIGVIDGLLRPLRCN